mgnify:CR=1 FL=1
MLTDHKQTDAIKNSIFNSYIDSYVALASNEQESEQAIAPENREDILDADFIARFDLTEEQLEQDMTMCRYFEGEE